MNNQPQVIERKASEAVEPLATAGVSVAFNESVIEHAGAPRFRYVAKCLSPQESRRAELIDLRDRMDGMIARAQLRAGQSPRARVLAALAVRSSLEYATLMAKLQAIPLRETWGEDFCNLVTTVGKNDLLTNQFKGSSYTAAWYLGLIDNASFSAVAAGDTMSSHAGWIESTAYSDGTRKTLSFGTASSGSLAASAVSFSINGSATINGAFCVTNSTKGGTTGTLYSAGSFAATRTVANGDQLNVTLTVTA